MTLDENQNENYLTTNYSDWTDIFNENDNENDNENENDIPRSALTERGIFNGSFETVQPPTRPSRTCELIEVRKFAASLSGLFMSACT